MRSNGSIVFSAAFVSLLVLPSPALSASKDWSLCAEYRLADTAIRACTAIIARDDTVHNLAAAHFYRANAWAYKGAHQRAIDDYDEALRLEPDLAEVYPNRGVQLSAAREFDRAIADFDTALRLQPNNTPVLLWRAGTLLSLGQVERAIADYDAVLKLYPDYALAYANRGTAWSMIGENNRAITDYRRAMSLEPRLNARAEIGYPSSP